MSMQKNMSTILKKKNEEIVSLHFRRGDNIDGTSSEYNDYYGKDR